MPSNIIPNCRHFPACGGCQILDLDYAEQLSAKEEELRRHFFDWPQLTIAPILPSPKIYGYRHKVQLPLGLEARGKEWKDMKRKSLGSNAPPILATLGCFAAGSHEVIDQEECLVQDPGLSQVAWAVRTWANIHAIPVYREGTGDGWLRHILLRKGSGTGEIILALVTKGADFPLEASFPDLVNRIQSALVGITESKNELVGIVQNVNPERNNVVLGSEEKLLWGRPFLQENLGAFTFSVGASTFFQVNPFQTPRLYDLALEGIPEGSSVLDLYSGIGSIALWVSRKAKMVLGIEANAASVKAARHAAQENGLSQVEFMTADVAQALIEIKEGNERGGSHGDPRQFDTAIVDPPRKGLEVKVKQVLMEMGLKRIVYVSCFPPTLARDAKDFAPAFKLVSLSPVDMFPHTRHVECVAIFEAV